MGPNRAPDRRSHRVQLPDQSPDANVGLAELASRLVAGTEVVIDYMPVSDEWNVARGLSISS